MKLKKTTDEIYIHMIFRILFLLLPAFIITGNTSFAEYRFWGLPKTQVLVVGTIHQLHSTDTNYTYYDIVNILNTYNPDVVCVEIRPEDFRKEPYLREMVLASIWAIVHNKKVYPVDWWPNDTRKVRDSLMGLPGYKEKEQELEAKGEKDTIITNFEKKYGSFREQAQMGYSFWNGKEYNAYIMENNRLWMEEFGDGPITLYYKSRNDSMMTRIQSAARENPGEKIIVLTGGEHKHYFDNVIEHDPDMSLVDFNSILPLEKEELDAEIIAYFDESNDMLYYEKGYPLNLNDYYRTKLIPILHGGNMDEFPDKVPANNIKLAEKVVERWVKDTSSSGATDLIEFELGWIKFLKEDYRAAIGYLLPLSRRIEAGTIDDPFLLAITHRNLGLCYDCMGERDNALACYSKGIEILRGTSFAKAEDMLFKNYQSQPYRRAQN